MVLRPGRLRCALCFRPTLCHHQWQQGFDPHPFQLSAADCGLGFRRQAAPRCSSAGLRAGGARCVCLRLGAEVQALALRSAAFAVPPYSCRQAANRQGTRCGPRDSAAPGRNAASAAGAQYPGAGVCGAAGRTAVVAGPPRPASFALCPSRATTRHSSN